MGEADSASWLKDRTDMGTRSYDRHMSVPPASPGPPNQRVVLSTEVDNWAVRPGLGVRSGHGNATRATSRWCGRECSSIWSPEATWGGSVGG